MSGVMPVTSLSMSPPAEQCTVSLSEEDRFHERKRDILVLVMRFLADYGFLGTYQSLCAEASMTLEQVDAADNIDLMTIVQEFVDYYHSKFGRYPKLIRHNYLPPPFTYQMAMQQQMQLPVPGQLMPQASMQQMHALQMQAAVAAATTTLQQQAQQQQTQQQQQQVQAVPLATGPQQVMLTQAANMSQPPAALPMALSSVVPVTSQPPAALPSAVSAAPPAALAGRLGMQQPPNPVPPLGMVDRKHPQLGFGLGFLKATQGHTSRRGSSEALDQDCMVQLLSEVLPTDPPSKYLSFFQPLRPKNRLAKRSEKINASDVQEEVMYALVGCKDMGWSTKAIKQETRDFLLKHYSIDKTIISMFFKNRSPRNKPSNNNTSASNSNNSSSSDEKEKEKRPRGAPAAAAAAAGFTGNTRQSSSGSSPGTQAKRQRPAAAAAAVALTAQAVEGAGQQIALGFSGDDESAAAAAAAVATAGEQSDLAGGAPMMTAAAAAAVASSAMSNGTYGSGFEGMAGLLSLTGLSPCMSLPGSLDHGYLGTMSGDLDAVAAAAEMGMGDGGCCSPCGFSS